MRPTVVRIDTSFRKISSRTFTIRIQQNTHALDKIPSSIFATLRYRDEDPIVEKPGAVIIANYASVTIISIQRKTLHILKDINFINLYTESRFAKICANVYLIEFMNSQ